MKSIFQFSVIALALMCVLLTGCERDKCTRTQEYIAYEPVYKLIDEMRTPVSFGNPRSMAEPGKIFYFNGYLLINEMHKGVHIIDDSNPSTPVEVGFLDVPGNIDMAINNNILYLDSYLDLVSVDISNPLAPVEVNRVNDVFQSFYSYDDHLGYLVEYVPTQKKLTIDCNHQNWGQNLWLEGDLVMIKTGSFDPSIGLLNSNSSISSNVVTGGSMARFTVTNNHLYTIDGSQVKVFDVTNPLPVLRNKVDMQWGVETLFPMAGNLFIGSNSGLLIYDISNPESPEYRSTFNHARACDPVVVSGNTAYVTLRDGSACAGYVNQLDVIDVTDLNNPSLIKSYPMQNPHGLSVVNQTLYLCEGKYGLKTYDISDRNTIDQHLLDKLTGFFAWDVIVLPPGDLVMVIGTDGLYQFDATDRSDLKQLSVISIKN